METACIDGSPFTLCVLKAARGSPETGKLVHPEKEQSVALKLEDKKVIVAEVNEAAGNALSAVVADYRGMDVGALTEMREKAREGKIISELFEIPS